MWKTTIKLGGKCMRQLFSDIGQQAVHTANSWEKRHSGRQAPWLFWIPTGSWSSRRDHCYWLLTQGYGTTAAYRAKTDIKIKYHWVPTLARKEKPSEFQKGPVLGTNSIPIEIFTLYWPKQSKNPFIHKIINRDIIWK